MKNTILIIAVLAIGLSAIAQTQPQEAPKEFDGKGHYLNVDFGVGLSSLMFKLDDGERKGKLGFSGKIGYDYYFTKNWGIGTGLGISWYKTGGKFNNHLTSYDWMDDDNVSGPNPYQRNIYLRNWEEIQKTLFLEIPLTANFQAKFGEKKRHGIYVNAGLRLQLPLKSTYLAPNERDAENGLLEVQAYYEQFGLTIDDVMAHGFGFYNDKYSGKNNLKLGLAATAGVGGLFGLSEKVDLYVGARVDYGFLNIRTDGNEKIISGDLNDYYGMVGSDVTEKVNPFSIRGEIGIRVKLVGKKKEADKKTDALERQLQYMNNENAKANEDRRRSDDDRRRADDDRRRADDDRRKADDDRRNAEQKAEQPQRQTAPGASKSSKSSGSVADDNALLAPIDGYNVGVTTLTNAQKKTLDKKIAVLKKNADVKFSLVGHTCDISNDEVNEKIGFERAEAVKEYIVSKGIDRSRIVDISTEGKYYPVVENSSESNRKKNRRVEFIIE